MAELANTSISGELLVNGTLLTDIISSAILDSKKQMYPVGTILMSAVNTNPSTYLGFGTWSAWGSGRVPVGVNTSDTNFSTVEKTGGSSTVTLTEAQMPSHTHTFTGSAVTSGNQSALHTHSINITSGKQSANHVHEYSATTSSNGAHTHSYGTSKSGSLAANGTNHGTAHNASGYNTSSNGAHTHTISGTTAGISANHSHVVNGTSGTDSANHTHSVTAKGTNSSTGSGSAHTNLQPYITCYMWKRTA